MLLILGAVINALVAMVISPRMRVRGSVNSSAFGWISEEWLAEHRASHSA